MGGCIVANDLCIMKNNATIDQFAQSNGPACLVMPLLVFETSSKGFQHLGIWEVKCPPFNVHTLR